MSSIKKNLSLQTAYQILSACTPLITAPYLARRLGAEQLGVFSYTTSIVTYFVMFAMLGTINYGTRCIASAKGNRQNLNKVFSGIFWLQVISSLISTMAYVVYLLVFCRDNQLIALLQGIALLACFADINWLFFGVEEFQITVTRNIIIKIATVGLILLLVNKESDLWLYTVIMLGGTLLSNAILFFYLPRYVSFTRVSWKEIMEHLVPNLVLFVPLLAMSVYHTMDKTMLGKLSTYEQSGFYYNSDKIVQIPLLVINGIGTVMLPRMSALLTENKQKEADGLFLLTLEGVAVLGIAMACGIAAVAKEFIPFFFGAGYEPCIIITIVFTPLFLIKGWSIIIRTQYLIPMQMEKEFTKSVVGGAIVNLVFNFMLIPLYGALGAAVATVIAELIACILQFVSMKGRSLAFGSLFRKTGIYLAIGLLMVIVVRLTSLITINTIVKLFLEVLIGAITYGVICLVFWKKSKSSFYEVFCTPVLGRLLRKVKE